MATPTERVDATSTALRRPPIRQATTVRSDQEHTFSVFVREIGTWWPTPTFSAGREQVNAVTVEPHRGGRVYETWHDDTTVEWGRLLVWDPPHRFTMSWTCTPAPTEVELTFTALGPALTRVAVEHRGWEALSEAQLREDCALPGSYAAGAVTTGWARILDALTRAAETDPEEPA
ncbi:SRPBCC domain-containing protein [Pseudonocardia saturnea]